MQPTTLSFYSVLEQQYDALLSQLGTKPDADGVVSGPTPLGVLKCQVAFHKLSGYLTVVVLDRPALLSIETIKHQIAMRLQEAADAAAVTPHVLDAVEVVAPAATESIAPEGASAPVGVAETPARRARR